LLFNHLAHFFLNLQLLKSRLPVVFIGLATRNRKDSIKVLPRDLLLGLLCLNPLLNRLKVLRVKAFMPVDFMQVVLW
jgi:hypothetical protein